ncbi:MAG: HlyD family efflux transporter periplasmic adaptor subunit [Planctomycetes bacterium]|nr:HlyD family efflux transporter periplasmic adaptor subunit [Planctomycetota bacterium]
MSDANPNVDLESLARPVHDVRPPRRRWLFVALPLLLIGGFLAVLASSLGDWLTGALEVEIVRPVPIAGGTASASAGTVVVQAAGWVEPDPFPIRVTALTSGVVREVLVLESDTVAQGAPVAQLIDDDARLGVRQADARLAEASAELARTEAELAAARESFEAALSVRERAATAAAELDGKRAEAARRAQAVLEARARLSAGESELEVQRYLVESGAAGPRAVELAEAALAEVKAQIEILAAEAELAQAGTRVAEAGLERARRELELRTEEHLRVATAEAGSSRARALRDQAQVSAEEALLRLARTTVRAPAAGVVLQRLVAPGAELSAENGVVATLYDPRSVRVRVDVPQGELAKLSAGQPVRIETEARAGKPYAGEVLRIVRQADINKVTLQVHVRIVDGDELLRPEMLVQARFLASGATPSAGAAQQASTGSSALRIPARLLVEGDKVWVLDALGKRAELRTLKLGATVGEELEVLDGLNLSDKLIASELARLEPGLAVRPKSQKER